MAAHDDTTTGEVVNVHVGPDWDSPLGTRVRAYLDEFADSIAQGADAVAAEPDAVLLTGDLDGVSEALGPVGARHTAAARAAGHAYCTCAARLSWELLRRLLGAGATPHLIGVLLETHQTRGDGRALLVCLDGVWSCLSVAYAEGQGAVARGGQA